MSMRIERSIVLNHVVSPYGIAGLSSLVFLLAWCFPDDLYSRLMSEPDLMFLDPRTLLFFMLCVGGFCFGLLLVDFLRPSPSLVASLARPTRIDGLVLALPLALTTASTLLVAAALLKSTPDLVTLLLEQQGGTLKNEFAGPQLGLAGWGANVQTVVLWWTFWQLSNFESNYPRSRWRRWVPWVVFIIGMFAQIVQAILKVSRSELMPVFAGLAVLYLLSKIRRGRLTTAGVFRSLAIFLLATISMFVAFGIFRGADGLSVALAEFVGYTLASYNRLAALLAGKMHYPYGGRGAYLVPFMLSNHLISSILPLKSAFGWPDYFDLWNSEFQGFQGSGLKASLIWSGAFGYSFADAGWGTPLVLAAYGFLYGIVWRGAKAGTGIGISLYPWFAFSALSWFSSNLLFDYRFPFFLIAAVALAGYERLWSRAA